MGDNYKYFGIFDPATTPTAGPEWMPILIWSREFGLCGIWKTTDPASKSKAMAAISVACLSSVLKVWNDYLDLWDERWAYE